MAKTKDSLYRYNLIEEKWIPIAGAGLVSLRDVFTNLKFHFIGGVGIVKVALMYFLLSICQAAITPKDDAEWLDLGASSLAKKVREYLEKHHANFFLYGKSPFLQIPAIAAANKMSFGTVMPEVGTGKNISTGTAINTTILTQSQIERSLTDAEKALLIVQLMGFALGGKKTDNSVVLSPGYRGKYNEKGKPSSGKPGTSLGFLGYLHSFLTGATLLETLWLNLLTKENIKNMGVFTHGLGPVPWETPPAGENDAVAEKLKNSLMGRLVPYSRFVLLADDGLHYSEGIFHPNHLDGVISPSMAVNKSGKDIKVLWADPSKRPWRSLASLLGFLMDGEQYFDCPFIHLGINRIKKSRGLKLPTVGIWSAGLRVSSNAGEQYVSGSDDFVESETGFESSDLDKNLYINLKGEMTVLEELSRILYGRVSGYHRELKAEGAPFAKQAAEHYWQLCERKFQDLVCACSNAAKGETTAADLRPYFLQCVRKSYDAFCSRETARQWDAWAENYPNLGKFAAAKEKAAETVSI
jgi:CRISPR system Cascade subunit CasA